MVLLVGKYSDVSGLSVQEWGVWSAFCLEQDTLDPSYLWLWLFSVGHFPGLTELAAGDHSLVRETLSFWFIVLCHLAITEAWH